MARVRAARGFSTWSNVFRSAHLPCRNVTYRGSPIEIDVSVAPAC